MNLQKLYQEVYGEHNNATEEELKQLGIMMTALPDNIFNTVYQHYVLHKPVEEVAGETGHPTHLVERWVKSGVSLLKVFAEADSSATSGADA